VLKNTEQKQISLRQLGEVAPEVHAMQEIGLNSQRTSLGLYKQT